MIAPPKNIILPCPKSIDRPRRSLKFSITTTTIKCAETEAGREYGQTSAWTGFFFIFYFLFFLAVIPTKVAKVDVRV